MCDTSMVNFSQLNVFNFENNPLMSVPGLLHPTA